MSYEKFGGLKSYLSYRNFKRNIEYLKVVFNEEKIIACATYLVGLNEDIKMTAIGCDQSLLGKEAMQSIIIDDIENKDLHYWVEASGAVEHFFKKHDGYPIPNTYVQDILNRNVVLSADGVHYERPLILDEEPVTKMIFGFKTDALYKEVTKKLENYLEFRKKVNNGEKLVEAIYRVEDAVFVVEAIEELIEHEIYEIPIYSYECLKHAYCYFLREKSNNYINRSESLLCSVTPLVLNEL